EDFERVFRAIGELYRVHSKADLNLDNLESVFAVFEMAQLLGLLPGTDESEIPRVVKSMRRVITKTLEEAMLFRYDTHGDLLPPSAYSQLVQLLDDLDKRKLSASILTFNYDVGLDFALHHSVMPFTYALADGEAGTKVLKLHGSLNWAKC